MGDPKGDTKSTITQFQVRGKLEGNVAVQRACERHKEDGKGQGVQKGRLN